MAPSDPEVIVDQVSNLSAAKETVLLLGLLFLQTDSSFNVGIMYDSVLLKQSSHQVLQNSALKYLVLMMKTFPDIPCVSQMLGGPSLRLGVTNECLNIPSDIG